MPGNYIRIKAEMFVFYEKMPNNIRDNDFKGFLEKKKTKKN